ncbi:M56 family metallopeptidase [bacterium]|nr:M56 family metallopeptidase [bacterium]
MNTEALTTFMGWLGRTSAQAAVLAVMILVVQALTRDKLPPRWRHALWFLLIIRLMLPWAPPHRMSVYNLIDSIGRGSASASVTSIQSNPMGSNGESGRSALRADSGADSGIPNTIATSVAPVSQVAGTRETFWSSVGSKTRPALLASIWCVGFVAFIGAAIWQSFALGAAMRGRRPVTDQRLLDLLESCKEAMGFRVWLMVIETPDVKSPALFGFIRPKLLIPAGAIDDLGPERLRHVFLHELAHLRRHDIVWNWLATLLLAAHWFNPLIWFAFHRMRADQELACDQLALSSIQTNENTAYGRTMIHLLEKFSQPARMPGLAGILEDQSQMKRRISMIAKYGTPSRKWSVIAAMMMGLLGCVALTNAQNKSEVGYDLVINDLFVLDQSGENHLVASIVNNGSSGSPIAGVWFYVNDPEHKNPIKAQVSPIAPGKTFNEAVPIKLAEGVNRFEAVLDAEKTIRIKDRANSSATIRKVVKNGRIMDLSAPAGEAAATAAAEPFKVETTTDAEGRYVDKIDYPFVNDPRVIGRWQSVDFVDDPAKFNPAQKSWKGDLFLKGITFFPEGKVKGWWKWTNGLLLHDGDKTASRYEIKQIDGYNYMFVEWKVGDYTIRHQKPSYYVLRQASNTITAADQPKRIVDKIDYPFVNDPNVIGRWGVVDLVKETRQFKPGERQFNHANIVNMFEFHEGGLVSLMAGKDQAMRKAPWYRWTNGILIHQGGDHTANHYQLKRIGDKTYMFLEFKNGDYILRGAKPEYFVLEKM